jgi:DNA-binding YbaB/EbfC family protein
VNQPQRPGEGDANDEHDANDENDEDQSVIPPGLAGMPGLGDMGDLGGLLESAQAALSAQARAAEQVVEGSAGGGVVTVEMTGTGEVRSVSLAPEVVDPDEVEMLQDLIVAALHDAAVRVTALQREALGAFGDLDLGGMGGMGGLGGPGGSGGPLPGPGSGPG